jgi:hypothetical protein
MIDAIMLDPSEEYTPGSDIGVSAIVTDRDGDPLEFYWSSNGGTLKEPDQPSTTWELSTRAEPLSYESITLTVTDGKGAVTRSKTIQVSEGLLIEGFTYFSGTSIPVPGVEITIGKFSTISDEMGYYHISNLKEGNTLVTATKNGFEPYEAMVFVDNPKSTYQIMMSSPTESKPISGQVKTVDNLVFEGLKVSLLNPDWSESKLFGFTDPSGRFEIDAVPLGIRYLMVASESDKSHFLNDSLIYQIKLDGAGDQFDTRIKIKRSVLSDQFMSEEGSWEYQGSLSEGFYQIKKGEQMVTKEFIRLPADAEKAMLYLNSYVIGGCDLVGNLPSHRAWIMNVEGEYMGGLSWGGEGNNYQAELEWYPSESPNFMDIYGKEVKLKLEVSEQNNCIPDPLWRIYQIEFSYYY